MNACVIGTGNFIGFIKFHFTKNVFTNDNASLICIMFH